MDTNAEDRVTVPPIHKQVIAESSGGDQSSIDTKTVFPARPWNTRARGPAILRIWGIFPVTAIKLSDTYSEYTTANKQTGDRDTGTGGIIPKSAYKVVGREGHSFEATFAKDWVAANWKAGSTRACCCASRPR